MARLVLKAQTFFLLACLVVHSYGYPPSGSAMGRSGYGGRGRFSGGGGGGFGGGYGVGYGGGYGGGFGRKPGGGMGQRSRGASVTISLSCDENTPYQDECQRPCNCQNDEIVCPPKSPCNNQLAVQSIFNNCPDMGGSFEKDCNTCVCLDIGSICTAKQC